MARTYKSKGIGTKPSGSGVKNMSKEYDDNHKESDKGVSFMADLFKISVSKMNADRSAWTPLDVANEVADYFAYCETKQLKPYINGMALYLGMSNSTMYEWMGNPQKYGEKSEILKQAKMVIEGQYVDRAEKYPTANLFLLRAGHGYVETSKLDVNDNRDNKLSTNDITDAITKLGLNK